MAAYTNIVSHTFERTFCVLYLTVIEHGGLDLHMVSILVNYHAAIVCNYAMEYHLLHHPVLAQNPHRRKREIEHVSVSLNYFFE